MNLNGNLLYIIDAKHQFAIKDILEKLILSKRKNSSLREIEIPVKSEPSAFCHFMYSIFLNIDNKINRRLF